MVLMNTSNASAIGVNLIKCCIARGVHGGWNLVTNCCHIHNDERSCVSNVVACCGVAWWWYYHRGVVRTVTVSCGSHQWMKLSLSCCKAMQSAK